IGAPMLALPFRYTETVGGESRRLGDVLFVLPRQLAISGRLELETRRRGIYEVPVYTATLDIDGTLPPPDLGNLADTLDEVEVLWSDAQIVLPLSDARPIAEPVRIRIGNAEAELEAGSDPGCVGGMSSPTPLPALAGTRLAPGAAADPQSLFAAGAPIRLCTSGNRLAARYSTLGLEPLNSTQSFSIRLAIRGTSRLHVLPLGD